MSKRNRAIEPEDQPQYPAATAAILDPPESGPPTEAELGQADDDNREAVAAISAVVAAPGEAIAAQVNPTVNPMALAAPDCSTIVAGRDRQAAPAWPTASPLKVDWPWGGEPDPVPGDIVGWNWHRGEIAVVTAVPPVTQPWPYTLTVEIRPMAEEWRQVKVFDLNSGQRLDVEWYTRWNRAYSHFAKDADGCVLADESGAEAQRITGSGWLAVVQEKAGR